MKFVATRISQIEFNKLNKKIRKIKTSPYLYIRTIIQKALKETTSPIEDKDLLIAKLEQEVQEYKNHVTTLIERYDNRFAQKEQELHDIAKIFNINDDINKELLKEIFNYTIKLRTDNSSLKLSQNATNYMLKFLYG